jgi:hypothetical protein
MGHGNIQITRMLLVRRLDNCLNGKGRAQGRICAVLFLTADIFGTLEVQFDSRRGGGKSKSEAP